ncbi:MAG: S41 family peptidase, partial [Bacteroidales bacterium]
DNTAEEFANAMAKLNKAGLKKVIIDLRSNGGGYLGAAVEIADMFLEKGDMIVFFGRFVPVIRQYISFPPGVVKMNFKKFVLF